MDDTLKGTEGLTAIHNACEKGYVDIVRALVESNPDLCLARDGRQLTPLHIATMKGDIALMKTLLKACPGSLKEATSHGETALHLAVKHGQDAAFKALMEETPHDEQNMILNMDDFEGNTAISIATAHKRIQILPLLPEANPKQGHRVQIISTKESGRSSHSRSFQDITKGESEFSNSSMLAASSDPATLLTLSNQSQLLALSLSSAAFAIAFNLNNSYSGNIRPSVTYTRWDLGFMQPTLYIIWFVTLAVNMFALAVTLLSMTKQLPLCFPALDLQWSQTFKAIALRLCQYGASWRRQSMQSSVLLTASSTLIAASAYSSIFKINGGTYAGIEVLSATDILLQPDLLPKVFYSIMFMTVAFTASMLVVVVPLWSVIKERSFLFQALQLLGLGAFFLSYAFTVKEKVPKFWVTTQSFEISSFWLVWLCGQPFILVLLIIWLACGKNRIFPKFCQPNQPTFGAKSNNSVIHI